MPTTIENFLIGVGLEYDKSGEKNALGAIKDIKTKALQLGAVLGGAFGIKALTIDTAKSAAQLERFAAAMGLSQKQVASFDSVVKQSGGTLEESRAIIESVTRTQDNLRKNLDESLRGELARIGVGADLGDIIRDAPDAESAITRIVERLDDLDKVTQRKGLQVLGLDTEAFREITRGGVGNLQNLLDQAGARLRIDAKLGVDAKAFNAELNVMSDNLSSIAREISKGILPPLTEFLAGMNEWIKLNREWISTGIKDATKAVADNFGVIAASIGIISGAAVVKGLVGVAAIAKGVTGIAPAAAATGTAALGLGTVAAGATGAAALGAGTVLLLKELEQSRQASIAPEERFDLFGRPASRIPENDRNLVQDDFLPFIFRPTEYRPEVFQSQRTERTETIREQSAGQTRPLQINLNLDGQVLSRTMISASEIDNSKTVSEFITSIGA